MKKSFVGFLVDQLSRVPPVDTTDLTGKTVVVVGANTGIGFETAKHFARMRPAQLIVACRNETKGKEAVSEIHSATGFECDAWIIDLAEFASVTKFAERFERECDRLDILVMNAAMLPVEYIETVDGWESGLQVNHLGTALLSLLLLPRLVDTGKKFRSTSRLVIVASEVHYWANLPEDVRTSSTPVGRLSSPRYRDPSSMSNRYFDTKLFNVLFARALQDHVQSITPLTVNSVNPGFCYSQLRRDLRGIAMNVFNVLMEMFLARTSEQGSRQLVYAAIGGRDNETHMKGAYVSNTVVAEPSDFVISEGGRRLQDSLWMETVEILSKEAPRLKSIIQEYLI